MSRRPDHVEGTEASTATETAAAAERRFGAEARSPAARTAHWDWVASAATTRRSRSRRAACSSRAGVDGLAAAAALRRVPVTAPGAPATTSNRADARGFAKHEPRARNTRQLVEQLAGRCGRYRRRPWRRRRGRRRWLSSRKHVLDTARPVGGHHLPNPGDRDRRRGGANNSGCSARLRGDIGFALEPESSLRRGGTGAPARLPGSGRPQARTTGAGSTTAVSIEGAEMFGFDAAALRIASVPSRSIAAAMTSGGSAGCAAARRRAYPTPSLMIAMRSSGDDSTDKAPTSCMTALELVSRRSFDSSRASSAGESASTGVTIVAITSGIGPGTSAERCVRSPMVIRSMGAARRERNDDAVRSGTTRRPTSVSSTTPSRPLPRRLDGLDPVSFPGGDRHLRRVFHHEHGADRDVAVEGQRHLSLRRRLEARWPEGVPWRTPLAVGRPPDDERPGRSRCSHPPCSCLALVRRSELTASPCDSRSTGSIRIRPSVALPASCVTDASSCPGATPETRSSVPGREVDVSPGPSGADGSVVVDCKRGWRRQRSGPAWWCRRRSGSSPAQVRRPTRRCPGTSSPRRPPRDESLRGLEAPGGPSSVRRYAAAQRVELFLGLALDPLRRILDRLPRAGLLRRCESLPVRRGVRRCQLRHPLRRASICRVSCSMSAIAQRSSLLQGRTSSSRLVDRAAEPAAERLASPAVSRSVTRDARSPNTLAVSTTTVRSASCLSTRLTVENELVDECQCLCVGNGFVFFAPISDLLAREVLVGGPKRPIKAFSGISGLSAGAGTDCRVWPL